MTQRTNTLSAMLAEFHDALEDKFGRARDNGELAELRLTLHREEHAELLAELDQAAADAKYEPLSDVMLQKVARELADVVYVSFGTAHAYGIDLDAAIDEIHRVAMNKLFPTDGSPRVVREDGKIMKPANFTPPDMTVALR
ncbi:MAG: hypothetical protein KGL39_38605 [Patescibacteria group bacterium]|nr:hypothetical protein [Patescibacteria group bacterium]